MGKIILNCGLIVLSFAAVSQCLAQDTPVEGKAIKAASPAAVAQPRIKKVTPDMYYYGGEKLYETFKYEAAIKYYSYAVKLDKNYLAAWKKLAFCYYKLNKHKYAFNSFKKVLSFDKNDKDALEFMEYYNNIMEKSKKQKEKREAFDSMWRAAALPGWGQYYNNQTMKGIIISAGVIVSGGLTVYSVVDQQLKYDKYLNTNENHDIAFKEAESASTTALIWAIVTAVIYTGGIVDAAINYDCVEARLVEAGINSEGAPMICANIRW